MDMNAGDGADSAEDSGSSQPYPSTLPGIPEAILFNFIYFTSIASILKLSSSFCILIHLIQGSARQLFQRLQGPMEEDTLKSHFEKIIMIGQKQHYRKRTQVTFGTVVSCAS